MADVLRVLIVEDDFLIAIELETIIGDVSGSDVTVRHSVESTKEVLHEPFDFAFLDIEVTDGKTFDIARSLTTKGIPFAFVSGAWPDGLPEELGFAHFIPKPFRR